MSLTLRQGTLEMGFGLFDVPVEQRWFVSKKIEHRRSASRSDVEY